jgi:hypothetical protein
MARRFCEASEQCNKSLHVVMANQSLGQIQVYGKLVGYFMGHSYSNILRPVWTANPELEPPEMRLPYEPPKLELEPESREAMEAFLVLAQSCVEFVKQNVPEEQQKSLFAYGGMPEVVESIEAIEEFLARPRFSNKSRP